MEKKKLHILNCSELYWPEQRMVRMDKKMKTPQATPVAIKMGWYFLVLEKTQLDFSCDFHTDSVL